MGFEIAGVASGRLIRIAGAWPMKVALLVAITVVSSGCKDMNSETDEYEARQRYHGEPSSTICRERWSHDVGSFRCHGRTLRVDELRPFSNLQSIQLSDAVVTRGEGARILTLTDANVNSSKFDTQVLVETFPRLERLSISGTAVDGAALRTLGELTFLQLHLTAPPDAATLAALPKLKTLWLTHVTCPQPGCGQALASKIRVMRPDLKIQVNE